MRIAALALTVAAALVTLWFFAMTQGLIRPPDYGPATIMRDDYYGVAHAGFCLPYAMLALMGGALTLALQEKPRRWALWLVLAGGLLALSFTLWEFFSYVSMTTQRTTFFDASGGGDPLDDMLRRLRIRRWLLWCGLGLSLAGWAAWLACRFRPAAKADG